MKDENITNTFIVPVKIGLKVKYHGATEHKVSRISITDYRALKPQRRYIAYDHKCNGSIEIAVNFIYKETGLLPIGQLQASNWGACDVLCYEWHNGDPLYNNYTYITETIFDQKG